MGLQIRAISAIVRRNVQKTSDYFASYGVAPNL